MMKQYLIFDFGESYYRDRKVVDLVLDKMPVSISLGHWTTLLVYLISIPLGIAKASRDGSRFDIWTSVIVFVAYAIPGFLFAVLLILLFASGNPFDWFPLGRLTSENWDDLNWIQRVADYAWHLALPVIAMTIGGFASLAMLTKNSFLDQINHQYVLTARAKGLNQKRVLYRHVFRNAMLIVIAGFPGAFISILFTGSLFIEIIFSNLIPGKKFLIDDGKLVFNILKIFDENFETEIMNSGILKSKKGINFPNLDFNISPLTDKDKKDLDFIINNILLLF